MTKVNAKNLTTNPKVIEVVKAYHAVNNTYYQMLIKYRIHKQSGENKIGNGTNDQLILHKAKTLHEKANSLAEANKLQAEGSDTPVKQALKQELIQLATTLASAVGEDTVTGLRKALNDLKTNSNNDTQIETSAVAVMDYYTKVHDAYQKLKARESDYQTLLGGANTGTEYDSKYTPVTAAFEDFETGFKPLKKSIENVVRLRVKWLSNKAQTLSGKANELSTQPGPLNTLTAQATDLKEAASKAENKSGLKEKADALATVIEGATGVNASQDTQVITAFDTVTAKYTQLTSHANYAQHKTNQYVKNVVDAYQDLKSFYDKTLNLSKIKHYSNALNSAANLLDTAITGIGPTDEDQLKAKAGTKEDEGLRGLAGKLYEAAQALATAPGLSASDATTLATNVGHDESTGTDSLRKKLKALYDKTGSATSEVSAVTGQYSTVSGNFGTVKLKKDSSYQSFPTQYQAVEAAWNNFNALYTANLKTLAGGLATAVGSTDSAGTDDLRQALNQLSSSASAANATTVIQRFNAVKDEVDKVTKQEYSYQNYTAAKTNYTTVKQNFNELKNAYSSAIYTWKFHLMTVTSIISNWLNFVTYVVLLFVYVPGDQGHLTMFYWVIAVSGFVFGLNNPLVFACDTGYLPIYIAGENCFPTLTSLIHYVATLSFGNRRKWNSDFILVYIDLVVAILISLAGAVVWTIGYLGTHKAAGGNYGGNPLHHIQGPFDYNNALKDVKGSIVGPVLMVLVGMGIVYAIYPAIAPGLIVPFYLIDKIEMTLLIMTIAPALSVAIARHKTQFGNILQPTCIWQADQRAPWGVYKNSGSTTTGSDGYAWHLFDLTVLIMIVLSAIFIYSLHYRDSSISRSIINQPKMSTCLTILFYMCHEISLAIGFPGVFGNNGGGSVLALLCQLIGAFLMIFLALYSEGYIIE